MSHQNQLSRRDFLRISGTSIGAFLLPIHEIDMLLKKFSWPMLRIDQIPSQIQEILDMVPNTMISRDGRLYLMDARRQSYGWVPLAQTQWNREHSHHSDRLYTTVPWGIVLHWYGDRENYDKTITGYLRGFNSLREVDGLITRTSAHFLVGGDEPSISSEAQESSIGIIQTQKAAPTGTPYVASHIMGLDYEAHKNRRQYFVRAQYQLATEEPGVHTILQDWFDGGRVIDPNMRTIGIEMTGYDFENRAHFPSKQQIANAISIIWALMRRYGISANNLFGHNEIQLNKPDPGKKFMGFMRYLVGAKALLENDAHMNQLVFGNFLQGEFDTVLAIRKYFKYVYDYLLMISKPNMVYEWEGLSGYWYLSDLLDNRPGATAISRRFVTPMQGEFSSPGRLFTQPANHEGIDLHRDVAARQIHPAEEDQALLAAQGEYIAISEFKGCSGGGKMAIFRHRQLNGSQVLSIYGHLNRINDLKIGTQYPIHYPIGEFKQDLEHSDPFLHFAMAYGGTWDTDLKKRKAIPLNVGASWIRERYQNPFNLMDGGFGNPPSAYRVT
jgi:hypothetical protein